MLKKYKYKYKKFPNIGATLISKMVIEQGLPPLFMYRENDFEDLGSGWRIFHGYEPDDYLEDAANFTFCSAATMIKIDPSMKDLLLAGIGSVFEREDESSAWYLVEDVKVKDDYLIEVEISSNWSFEINKLFVKKEEAEYTQYFTVGDKSVRITTWTTDFSKALIAQELEGFIPKQRKRKKIG